jgi:uncharacterized protein (TIGR02996 family)
MRSRGQATSELRDVLAAWRMSREPTLADTIDQLTREALAAWQPPHERDARAFHRAWFDHADALTTRGWAAGSLTELLPGEPAAHQTGAFVQRVSRLRRLGPDPRVCRAVLALIRAAPPILHVPRAFDACVAVIAGALDARLTAQLEEVAVAVPSRAKALRDVIAALRLEPPGIATLRIGRREVSATMPTELADLWRDVLANPDDDGARGVLADALQARGDPRGELIALQLATDVDEVGYARIDELLQLYGAGWLGPLQAISRRAHFSRGFVTRLELREREPGRVMASLDSEPSLATVEAVVVGEASGNDYALVVGSTAAISLHHVEVFDEASLKALETSTAPLTHVAASTRRESDRGAYLRRLRRVLPACARYPNLTSIAIPAWAFDEADVRPRLMRFAELALAGGIRRGLAAWPDIPGALAIVPDPWLEACTMAAWDYTLRIARVGEGVAVRMTGSWLLQSIEDAIDGLPANVYQIELAGMSEELLTRVRRATARRPITIVRTPLRRTRNVQCS